MSPENRTRSVPGPLPRRRTWRKGGTLASLALVMVGITSPAFAAAQGMQVADTVSSASPTGGDECKSKPNKKKKGLQAAGNMAGPRGGGGCEEGKQGPPGPPGPRGPRGPQGEPGPALCRSIDSVRDQGSREFTAVIPGGTNTYVGVRDLTGNTVGDWTWYDLTLNADNSYPADACGVSVAHQGGNLVIQVVTEGGAIHETFCTVDTGNGQDPTELVCNGVWRLAEPQPDPGDPDVRRRAASGTAAPIRPADPNHLPRQMK
ncbi:hypothetical protein [Streptomyces sp. NBC_01233]|uniref:hypothetical protein n=1 Tax=Streptomyces sp. NBC_01233 TaxID=2903787 RepID=UPI002E1001E1|nr:hypothetical protein OG332_21400 [Streptomyces sp. NBC_01233]